MSRLKKFWIVFVSMLPFGAGAASFLWTLGLSVAGIVGVSVYRSFVPTDMEQAMAFFSTCWTCSLFSGITETLSIMLPRVYHAVGGIMIPLMASLVAVWFAWKLFSGYINGKVESPWNMTSDFSQTLIKFALVCALLVMPLPRIIGQTVMEPVFAVGTSLNKLVTDDYSEGQFTKCMIASAIQTPIFDAGATQNGAYSPYLRDSLACELANVHQLTGLGMTTGWAMLNSAFDARYMPKVLIVPVFPNVPMFFLGLAILVLYLMALLPVPLYFLEIIVEISMDLVLLPLMLMAWMFKGWSLFPKGISNIKSVIDRLIKGVLGLAFTGIFVTFATMFLDAMFKRAVVSETLAETIRNNDVHYLIDGLMMQNDSVITIILMGIFIAMFMTMIPALSKTLFNVEISQKYYDGARKDLSIVLDKLGLKKLSDIFKPKGGSESGEADGSGAGGDSSSSDTDSNKYTFLDWLQSDGLAFIKTDFIPDDTCGIKIDVTLGSSGGAMAGTEQWHVGADTTGVYYVWCTKNYGNPVDSGSGRGTIYMNYENNRKCKAPHGGDYDITTSLPSEVYYAYVFGRNLANGYAEEICANKIHSVIFTRGGAIVHQFVPACRISDGVLGLYDKQTNRFYTNDGNGSFITGA